MKLEDCSLAGLGSNTVKTHLYQLQHWRRKPRCLPIKIARLSAALAFLTLSTKDFREVIVTRDHVLRIVKFTDEEYTKIGLDGLARAGKPETQSQEYLKGVETLCSLHPYSSRKPLESYILSMTC